VSDNIQLFIDITIGTNDQMTSGTASCEQIKEDLIAGATRWFHRWSTSVIESYWFICQTSFSLTHRRRVYNFSSICLFLCDT